MSAKTKTGLTLSETSKVSPGTPKVSKVSRGVSKSESDFSPSPLQSSRLSIDRSPRTATPKTTVDRRSPKVVTPPEAFGCQKPQGRVVKETEFQAQLSLVQEDLKKAKDQIASIEKEKAQAIDELKKAQKVAEEANERLQEALVAQKRAEENSEIEKFRAVEMEQAGIEAAHKKEEEWQKEIEAVRSQHALDVASLLSTTQELHKLKQELVMITDAKNQALSHADDATKIAEIHAEKSEILSAELTRLKALLDSKLEADANEKNKVVSKLKEEIDSLKQELERSKGLEKKMVETEASIEQLNVEVEAGKMAESYARMLAEEWKGRVDVLEMQLQEAKKLEKSASESLVSVTRQLEDKNCSLHEAELQIAALKEKVELLETTIGRQKEQVEELECSLDVANKGGSEIAKQAESLKSELETVKEEKARALNNEALVTCNLQNLQEENSKLTSELESSREEEEKSKKAMEGLASALHEVSSEAREAKEQLLSKQAELENFRTQVEDLRMVLKMTNEKNESMLEDAKGEIGILRSSIEESKIKFENSKTEWEQKAQDLTCRLTESEEGNASLEKEVNRLLNLLKESEEGACAAREEEAILKADLKKAETEVVYLQEALGEAKAESMKLKENLLDKENELHSISQENEDLRSKEAVSLKKIEELSKLLEEDTAKKQPERNDELSESEKEYDLLPKVVEFSGQNGHTKEEMPKLELPYPNKEEPRVETSAEKGNGSNIEAEGAEVAEVENANGKAKEVEYKETEDDSVEVEFKMWESCKIERKELSPERETEPESFEEEADSKAEGGESFEQNNGLSSTENADDGGSSPSKQDQQQPQKDKKKKPLLRKFGSLLKKKGPSNHK